jgi:hypothetical protein
MSPIEIAQKLLEGRWQHAPAALQACQRGEWASFVRAVAPPRPLLVGRIDHARCLKLAERSLKGPETVRLTLVPMWACSTAEEPSNQWVAVHGVVREGQRLFVREPGPFISVDDASPSLVSLADCTVRRWTGSVVEHSYFYAPNLPRRQRMGAFCLVVLDMDHVLDIAVRNTEPHPRPTREVPMFASWFEPRVKVPSEIEAQIRALCITAGDESGALR